MVQRLWITYGVRGIIRVSYSVLLHYAQQKKSI